MFTIYKHTNTITGKVYVGYTGLTIEDRWKQHVKLASFPSRQGKKTVKLWNAIRKYGTNCWTHEILGEVVSQDEAKKQEICFITEYNSLVRGYNSTPGGDGVMQGQKHTEEARKKIAAASKGRIFSKEACKKISNSKLGKPRSPETIEKIRIALTGKPGPNKGRVV
jgi:group I intron endonuclease